MGYLNPGAFSKCGRFWQDQVPRTFWRGSNVSANILYRTKCPARNGIHWRCGLVLSLHFILFCFRHHHHSSALSFWKGHSASGWGPGRSWGPLSDPECGSRSRGVLATEWYGQVCIFKTPLSSVCFGEKGWERRGNASRLVRLHRNNDQLLFTNASSRHGQREQTGRAAPCWQKTGPGWAQAGGTALFEG